MKSADHNRISNLLKRPEPVTWVFTGDSITHGAKHTFGARDYSEHFSERVRWELRRTRDAVIKTGISGWTIAGFQPDIEWSCLRYRPDVVSLNFGMNDCRGGKDGLAVFHKTYCEVVAQLHAAGAAVILHTPNGVLATDEVHSVNLPPYVEAIRDIAREAQCALVDHWTAWQGGYLWYWLSDAIHPSDLGHRVMAQTLLRELDLWDDNSEVCRLFVPSVRD